jgi:drug/metabolite transporter (DMT)-like permease
MTAFVLLYAALSRQSVAPPAAIRDRLRAVFIGFATILAYASYSIGIERYLTSVVGPLAAAYPLVTVVLAVVILREKTAINQKVGIAGVIGGVILLAV